MSDTPPFSPTIALLTLGRHWEAALSDAIKPFGLTVKKYGLLGHIHRHPGISFSELARRSRMTVQSAHAAVAAFVVDGWVADSSARAGASSHLGVTPAGERLLAEIAGHLAQLDKTFTESSPGLVDALRHHVADMMRENA